MDRQTIRRQWQTGLSDDHCRSRPSAVGHNLSSFPDPLDVALPRNIRDDVAFCEQLGDLIFQAAFAKSPLISNPISLGFMFLPWNMHAPLCLSVPADDSGAPLPYPATASPWCVPTGWNWAALEGCVPGGRTRLQTRYGAEALRLLVMLTDRHGVEITTPWWPPGDLAAPQSPCLQRVPAAPGASAASEGMGMTGPLVSLCLNLGNPTTQFP